MAGPFYVDPAATGTNDGSSWTNAWTSIVSAFGASGPAAGEICYCRGTETFTDTTARDVATKSGTNAAGFIRFIGCNSAGNQDGTRFVLDAATQAQHVIQSSNGQDMLWFENFKFTRAGTGKNGFHPASGTQGWVFVNCSFDNNAVDGVGNTSGLTYGLFFRCCFYSNSGGGCTATSETNKFILCSFHDNGGDGLVMGTTYGCLIYDNTDDGISLSGAFGFFVNTVIDGNGDDGILLVGSSALTVPVFVGCRITNHNGTGDIGLNGSGDPFITLGCYYDNNADNIANDALMYNLSIDGTTTSSDIESSQTLQGYISVTDGSENFNLHDTNALLRRTAIAVPLV